MLKTIILVYLAQLTFAQTTNLLTGGSCAYTTTSSGKITYDYSHAYSRGLFDDSITAEHGMDSHCAGQQTLGDEVMVEIFPTTTIQFRSIVVILSHNTLQSAGFTGYSLKTYDGETETFSSSVTGSHVFTADLLLADKLVITSSIGADQTDFCIDSVIAMDSEWLNPYAHSCWVRHESSSMTDVSTNEIQNSQVTSSIPFLQTFDTQNCESISSEVSPTSSMIRVMQLIGELNTDPLNSVLSTGMLVQFGASQSFYSPGYLSFTIFADSNSDGSYEKGFLTEISSIDGSFYSAFATPRILSKAKLYQYATTMNICSYHIFGYRACTYSYDTADMNWNMAVGMDNNQQYTKSFTLTTTIGDRGIVDTDFCEIGLEIGPIITGVTTTYSLTENHITLTTDSSLMLQYVGAHLVDLSIYDLRLLSVRFQNDLNVNIFQACDAADILGVTFYDNSQQSQMAGHSITLKDIDLSSAYEISYAQQGKTLSCGGLQSYTLTLKVILADSTDVSSEVLTDLTQFEDCVASANQNCIGLFDSDKLIKVYFSDNQYHGLTTFYLQPQIVYTATDGQIMTYTYQDSESGSFQIQYYHCNDALFSDPVDISTNEIWSKIITTTVNDPATQLNLFISDSLTDNSASNDYCGSRSYTITTASSEQNISLAEELLACTEGLSCLRVSANADTVSADLSLSLNEDKYGGQKLTFTITVSLDVYSAKSQSYDFEIDMLVDNTCLEASDLQGVQVIDASTGQLFTSLVFEMSDNVQEISYDYINLPTCDEYASTGNIQPHATLFNDQGYSAFINTNEAGYQSCLNDAASAGNRYCWWNSYTDKKIYFAVSNIDYRGQYTISFRLEVSAQNDQGQTISNTYSQADYTEFQWEIQYNCLTVDHLKGVTLTWDDGSQIPCVTTLRAEHDFTNGAISYRFLYGNEPVCSDYTNSMLTFQVKIVDRHGTEHLFSTSDWSQIGLDLSTNRIYVDFSDGTFNGLNTVTITPVITYSESLSYTYSDSESGSFQFIVYQCQQTSFESVYDVTYSDAVEGLPNFVIGQDDPSITKKIRVYDSLSTAAGLEDFCGPRRFTVTVDSAETNPLATSYLDCASGVSCFEVVQDNSGAYDLYLTVSFSSADYINTQLNFNLNVQLTNYLDVGQPSQDFAFNIHSIDTCSQDELQTIVINGLQTVQSGVREDTVVDYTLSGIPTCYGYQNFGTLNWYLTNVKDSTTLIFTESESEFNTCVADAVAEACLLHDLAQFKIRWFFYNGWLQGQNTINLQATVTAPDKDNVEMTEAYNWSFTNELTWYCNEAQDLEVVQIPLENYEYVIGNNNILVHSFQETVKPACQGYNSYYDAYTVTMASASGAHTYQFTDSSYIWQIMQDHYHGTCMYKDQSSLNTNIKMNYYDGHNLAQSGISTNVVSIVPKYYGLSKQNTWTESTYTDQDFTFDITTWSPCTQYNLTQVTVNWDNLVNEKRGCWNQQKMCKWTNVNEMEFSHAYVLEGLPICTTFTQHESGTIQVEVRIVFKDQTEQVVDTDLSNYEQCKAEAAGFCIYHNPVTQEILWQIFDTTQIGEHTVYIAPTLTANDINQNLLTEVYSNEQASQFIIEVHWMCITQTDLATASFEHGNFPLFMIGQDTVTTWQYQRDDDPTCEGYNNVTQSSFTVVLEHGTTGHVHNAFADYAGFTNCNNQKSQVCIYHDAEQQQVSWQFNQDLGTILDDSIIYITPTYWAVDYRTNSEFSLTYTWQDSGSVTLFVDESCMVSQFIEPTEIIDLGDGEFQYNEGGMPDFRTRVKAFYQLQQHHDDPWHDDNFYWTNKTIWVNDTLEIKKGNASHCEERSFQLSIADSMLEHPDYRYADTLLKMNGDGCHEGSCIWLETEDQYKASIHLRVLDDVFESKVLTFNIKTKFQRTYEGTVFWETSPEGSWDFTVTIDPCVVNIYDYEPKTESYYKYFVYDDPQPLLWTVTRIPNCLLQGRVMMEMNGTLVADNEPLVLQETYGLKSNQITVNDNKVTIISIESYFEENTWLNDDLLINLNYTMGLDALGNPVNMGFGMITADYRCRITSAKLEPNSPFAYEYTIGTIMETIPFTIQRDPLCPTPGTINLYVAGSTPATVKDVFGLITTQSTDKEGFMSTILLSSSWQSNNLAEEVLTIRLEYIVEDYKVEFPEITATYLAGNFTEVAQTAPDFTAELVLPDIIPCLDTQEAINWVYEFPDIFDANGDEIFTDFQMNSLKIVQLQLDPLQLKLDLPTRNIPKNGPYIGKIQLIDSSGLSTDYELEFEVRCDKPEYGGYWEDESGGGFIGVVIEEDKPIPPEPKVQKIQNDGKIFMYWSRPMKRQDAQGTSTALATSNNSTDRLLQSIDDGMDLQYIQRSDPEIIDPALVSFTYNIMWLDQQATEINLDFAEPAFVSADSTSKDRIKITFTDNNIFQAMDGTPMPTDISIEMNMPKQLPRDAIALDTQSVEQASLAAMGASLILGFFFGAVLNQILAIVENIGIILHMFILSLEYPVHVQDFFAALFPLVTFDLFPTDDLYEDMFGFEAQDIEEEPISEQFEITGYEFLLIVENMGSLWFICLLQPGIWLILAIFRFVLFPISCLCLIPGWNILKRKFTPKIDEYFKALFWNNLIKFVDQQYEILLLMCMIGFTSLRLDDSYTATERYNSWLVVILFPLLLIYPFGMALLYYKKIGRAVPLPDLDDRMQMQQIRYVYGSSDLEWIRKNAYTKQKHEEFMEKYGVLIGHIDLERLGKPITVVSIMIPQIRKLIFAAGIMIFLETPMFSIITFNYVIIFYVCFVVYFRVFDSKREQDIHIINELVLMVVNYHLFCFTSWIGIKEQSVVGNSIIYFVLGQTMCFMLAALHPIVKSIKDSCYRRVHWCKERSRRRAARKMRLERQKQIENQDYVVAVVDEDKTLSGQKLVHPEDQIIFGEEDQSAVRMMILEKPTSESSQQGAGDNFSLPSRKLIINLPPVQPSSENQLEQTQKISQMLNQQDEAFQELMKTNEGRRAHVQKQLASIESVNTKQMQESKVEQLQTSQILNGSQEIIIAQQFDQNLPQIVNETKIHEFSQIEEINIDDQESERMVPVPQKEEEIDCVPAFTLGDVQTPVKRHSDRDQEENGEMTDDQGDEDIIVIEDQKKLRERDVEKPLSRASSKISKRSREPAKNLLVDVDAIGGKSSKESDQSQVEMMVMPTQMQTNLNLGQQQSTPVKVEEQPTTTEVEILKPEDLKVDDEENMPAGLQGIMVAYNRQLDESNGLNNTATKLLSRDDED